MSKQKPRDSRSSVSRNKTIRLAIIGAGRLGTALGIGLSAAGVEGVAAVCRRRTHAITAASLIGGEVMPFGANQLSELPEFDVALIATPDDAIVAATTALAATGRATRQLVLHVSGSLPSTILRPVLPRGVSVGSMHPLLAISAPRVGAAGLRSAFFCIEG
jgi:predicted short-subunit dehydrogenase-like oxidoreductase (DUF2520 family)